MSLQTLVANSSGFQTIFMPTMYRSYASLGQDPLEKEAQTGRQAVTAAPSWPWICSTAILSILSVALLSERWMTGSTTCSLNVHEAYTDDLGKIRWLSQIPPSKAALKLSLFWTQAQPEVPSNSCRAPSQGTSFLTMTLISGRSKIRQRGSTLANRLLSSMRIGSRCFKASILRYKLSFASRWSVD